MKRRISKLAAVIGVSLAALATAPAFAVDWSAVPAQRVALLYPAQTSFEWSLTPKDHSAAQKFKEGKNCKACHIDEEEKYGVPLAEGKRWEPSPIPGKRGAVPLNVQWANDGQALHLRVQWQGIPDSGNPQMDKEYPAKLSLIISAKDNTFNRAGCWAVCHDDQTDMASARGATREKYLAQSRMKIRRSGGGDALRPQAQLDKMLAGDRFLELWQALLKPNSPAKSSDGYILEKRHMHASPSVSAKSSHENGKWTVELSRPLKAPAGAGHLDLVPGNTYTVGISLHEDHAGGRFHQVSWEYSLVLDSGKADFVAAKH